MLKRGLSRNRTKVVLTADIAALGKTGEIKEVACGYARNFLLPRRLALPYSKGVLKDLEARRSVFEKERKTLSKTASETKVEIEKLHLEFTVLVDEKGDLYGSVSKGQILKSLRTKSVVLPKGFELILKEPLKSLGTANVPVRLHQDVMADLKVSVIRGEPSKP